MFTNLLKSMVLTCFSLFCLNVFSAELSLEDLRKEVLESNLDVQIQYEKYYQAQRNIGVARGQFLPGLSIQLINVNATLAILQSVVPTPSDWFVYQASKELSTAEKFTSESIKLNILEGLTINYISIKHYEMILESLYEQDLVLEEAYNRVKTNEELGLATPAEVFMAKRNLLQHRQDIFALKALITAEKQAMMIALNRSPIEEVILADLPEENLELIPATIDEGTQMALRNSTELLSNKYQAEAAKYMIKSAKWSFISFDGIGFGYTSTLAIEKSKARVIELQADQMMLKIQNQVYSSYEELDLLDQRIALQEQVLDSVREMDVRNTELYNNRVLGLTQFLESRAAVAAEERTLLRLKMERRVKIAKILRLLGVDASLNNFSIEAAESLELTASTSSTRMGSTLLTLEVTGDEAAMANIYGVTYSVGNSIKEARIMDSNNNYALHIKMKIKGDYNVIARIRLINGEVVERSQVISVK